jgi:uncharacterized protein (TIGR03382 family)
MKKVHRCGAAGRSPGIVMMLAMLALGVIVRPAAGQAPRPDAEAAREAIAEGNRVWGRARVAHDRATFERMRAPEFYVQSAQGRMTRQEFIDMISGGMPGTTLTRFDASVLTVQPAAGGGWTAVILEKLETERPGPDGRPVKGYSLWITRDGWRQAEGRWQITSSEVIGMQAWRDGAAPPLADWE